MKPEIIKRENSQELYLKSLAGFLLKEVRKVEPRRVIKNEKREIRKYTSGTLRRL